MGYFLYTTGYKEVEVVGTCQLIMDIGGNIELKDTICILTQLSIMCNMFIVWVWVVKYDVWAMYDIIFNNLMYAWRFFFFFNEL